MEPWDSKLRIRRLDENDRPISDEEHAGHVWIDITSNSDPGDVRRLIRARPKEAIVDMKFRITVKRGPVVVATYEGIIDVSEADQEHLFAKMVEAEQFMEMITGLRHHIEQIL